MPSTYMDHFRRANNVTKVCVCVCVCVCACVCAWLRLEWPTSWNLESSQRGALVPFQPIVLCATKIDQGATDKVEVSAAEGEALCKVGEASLLSFACSLLTLSNIVHRVRCLCGNICNDV
jgi:hypothetical protein